MRIAVRAILIRDSKILVLHRNKFGQEYDTLPGGGIDSGENAEQALKREMLEETSLLVTDNQLVIIEHAGEPYGDQYIFLIKTDSATPQISNSSDEAKINLLGQNLYELRWLDKKQLEDTELLSFNLKREILKYFDQPWPEKVIEIG